MKSLKEYDVSVHIINIIADCICGNTIEDHNWNEHMIETKSDGTNPYNVLQIPFFSFHDLHVGSSWYVTIY